MDPVTLNAFSNELQKMAGLGDLWQRVLDVFRTPDEKVNKRVEYHFSSRAGSDRWDKFLKNVPNSDFVDQLAKHPDADPMLVTHARSMHALARAPAVNKIQSEKLPGQTYEVKKLPAGDFGCTCNDWRFKGSTNPGYECKHIRAHHEGRTKAVS